jgi:glucokinase
MRGGIDLGGTKIQAVIVDDDHEVQGQARGKTPTKGGPQDVADEMAATLEAAADDAGIKTKELTGVGVGTPGSVDAHAGTVTSARNLPGWEGEFPLAKALGDALKTEVKLTNDVDASTQAEFRLGVGRDHDDLLGVFWGTGVGGGIILDGKQWVGRGAAGEIGHMVVRQDGRQCPCGRLGCMEAYAGRGAMEVTARKRADDGAETVLFEIMEDKGRARLTSGVWEKALEEGDSLADELLDEAVSAIGAAVASVVNVLDIGVVVIGGGMGVRLGEPWASRIRGAMQPHLFSDWRPPLVEVAILGDLGGAIGAAFQVES